MTIKTRIEKLERQTAPSHVITVILYETNESGQRVNWQTGQPLPARLPGQDIRDIKLDWGDN